MIFILLLSFPPQSYSAEDLLLSSALCKILVCCQCALTQNTYNNFSTHFLRYRHVVTGCAFPLSLPPSRELTHTHIRVSASVLAAKWSINTIILFNKNGLYNVMDGDRIRKLFAFALVPCKLCCATVQFCLPVGTWSPAGKRKVNDWTDSGSVLCCLCVVSDCWLVNISSFHCQFWQAFFFFFAIFWFVIVYMNQ